MSKIQEIRNEIFDINSKIIELSARKRKLCQQLWLLAMDDFQRRFGVKKGDVLTHKNGDKYQYERVYFIDDTTLRVYVHKLKADGQPCKYETWFHPSEFVAPKADE